MENAGLDNSSKKSTFPDSKQKRNRQRYNRKAQRINDAVAVAERCIGMSPQEMFEDWLDFMKGIEILSNSIEIVETK